MINVTVKIDNMYILIIICQRNMYSIQMSSYGVPQLPHIPTYLHDSHPNKDMYICKHSNGGGTNRGLGVYGPQYF